MNAGLKSWEILTIFLNKTKDGYIKKNGIFHIGD